MLRAKSSTGNRLQIVSEQEQQQQRDRSDPGNPDSAVEKKIQEFRATGPPEKEDKWSIRSTLATGAGVLLLMWLVIKTGGEAFFRPIFTETAKNVANFIPRLAYATAMFFVLKVVNRVLKKLVRKAGEARIDGGISRLVPMLESAVEITVFSFGAISVLGTLGVDVSALVAGLGLTGFALGFALKDVISNMLAGIIIILFQPFKIGDTIYVQSYQGEVVAVDLRYTTLISDGTRKILIPNSSLFTSTITVVA